MYETSGVSVVPDPDLEDLGPAMRVLSPAQRRFAMAAVLFPLAKDWQIARAAGYSDRSHGSLRVKAHNLFHSEKVLAAIKECADKEVRSSGMLAIATIKKIVRLDGHKDQFKAAAMLAGLNGHLIEQKISVNQTVSDLTGKAMLGRIIELAGLLGVDPKLLVGENVEPKLIEGEVVGEV